METSEIKVEYEADLDLVDDFVNRVFQDGDSFQGSTGVGTSSEDETENSNDDDPEFYVSSESKPIRRGVRRRTVVKKSNHSEGYENCVYLLQVVIFGGKFLKEV